MSVGVQHYPLWDVVQSWQVTVSTGWEERGRRAGQAVKVQEEVRLSCGQQAKDPTRLEVHVLQGRGGWPFLVAVSTGKACLELSKGRTPPLLLYPFILGTPTEAELQVSAVLRGAQTVLRPTDSKSETEADLPDDDGAASAVSLGPCLPPVQLLQDMQIAGAFLQPSVLRAISESQRKILRGCLAHPLLRTAREGLENQRDR